MLDISWQKEERFDEVMIYSYQALFDAYIARGYNVPKYVQRTVLYDLVWYLRKIVNRSETVAFLAPSQKGAFLLTWISCFPLLQRIPLWNLSWLAAGFSQSRNTFRIQAIKTSLPDRLCRKFRLGQAAGTVALFPWRTTC